MGAKFWIRRYLTAFAVALLIITAAQILKGHTIRYSLGQGFGWGLISAALFTGTQFYRSRPGQRCEIRNDTAQSKSGSL
jgi:hypothetical protein